MCSDTAPTTSKYRIFDNNNTVTLNNKKLDRVKAKSASMRP